MPRILYLSYDGMTDPLGPSQVLPYLEGLARLGHRITLVSFEKPERSAAERAAIARRCEAAGIFWEPQLYTQRPPVLSTVKDLRVMTRVAEALNARERFDIVHCRSYLPALVGARMKQRHGTRFLFDMRGFWVDERIEGGLWPLSNPVYAVVARWFRGQEKRLLAEADAIISLTEAGEATIKRWRGSDAGPPVTVIPCCIDEAAYPPITPERRAEGRKLLGISETATVALTVGSLVGWYRLDRMMALFAEQRRQDPGAIFLFVTRDHRDLILSEAARAGVPTEALLIRSATRDEVPLFAAAADYAVLFGKAGTSPLARSPVKLGEYLAMELPVITDRVIGDVGVIMEESGAGVLVDRFDAEGYRAAISEMAGHTADRDRSRGAFRRWFDLDQGIRRYADVYSALSR